MRLIPLRPGTAATLGGSKADRWPQGSASIYGVRPDGRLTYAVVDAATGTRTHGPVVSSESLGFVPAAMATLNLTTVLATTASGGLHRIDVLANNTSLTFNAPVHLGDGWPAGPLVYDGDGHLYGIADGVLTRWTVTASKPEAANLTGPLVIGSGFALTTLTTTGPDRLLGTAPDGRPTSYRIRGANDWIVAASTTPFAPDLTSLVCPGGGVCFGHAPDGSLHRFLDRSPAGDGTDLVEAGTVDTDGWRQVILSAQPRTVS
ncbi:hypothetical protein AB0M47_12480 [Hamadaea sp. NPDC051192]|uniref:hypothetical protein n=1 Tax=Hamadaea sp. NPDC051192 TaxID=3154940 RepID=UPI003447B978